MENKEIKKLEFTDVKEIHQKILDTYPFLTMQDKKSFESKAEKFVTGEKLFKKDKINFLEKLLRLLKNSHAIVVIRKNKWKGKSRYFQKNEIKDDILYIRIYTWAARNQDEVVRRGQELIDLCVKNRNKYKSIIFDVRGNEGGSSMGAGNLSAIFFKKDFVSGYLYRRENGKLVKKSRTLKHSEEYYIDVPIIILVDEKCFSSTELFISTFKIGKRATLIGQTTKGGSANPFAFDYKVGRKKIIVKIPTWRLFLKGEKKPLEETKIKPDIFYKKDDIVEYAKSYLKNKK
jgi:C-terminal processing protease CtpA/Prc